MNLIVNIRLKLFFLLIVVTIMGFFSKFYRGPAEIVISNHVAGMWYVIFWVVLVKLIYTDFNTKILTTTVFIITTQIEFLQLYRNPILIQIRSTFMGRTLIGSIFNTNDFSFYFIGALISILLLNIVEKNRLT